MTAQSSSMLNLQKHGL